MLYDILAVLTLILAALVALIVLVLTGAARHVGRALVAREEELDRRNRRPVRRIPRRDPPPLPRGDT